MEENTILEIEKLLLKLEDGKEKDALLKTLNTLKSKKKEEEKNLTFSEMLTEASNWKDCKEAIIVGVNKDDSVKAMITMKFGTFESVLLNLILIYANTLKEKTGKSIYSSLASLCKDAILLNLSEEEK